nr:glutamic acid-rich protein-like [Tanacetum cinerariifolium]
MCYEKPPPKLTFYKVFFSTQWKFLIHTLIQRLSAKRTAWNEFSYSMAFVVICLATGRKFNFSKYIFDSMVRNVDSPSKFLIVGKGFSGVETPLFASMLVPPQPQSKEEAEEVKVPIAPAPSPPALQDPILTPYVKPPQDQPSTPYASPPQEQPTTTSESSMFLLTTLMETYATLSQRVAGGKIEAIDADKDITLVDVEKDEEGVSAAEPTVFDDEDVTMTKAQTLINLKAEKAKLFDEHIAQKLHDEEVQERHLDNIKKYQNLKKKHVSIAQDRKNMIIYLKNMAGYKMEHFRGMTYDKESFKKLRAAEVSSSESLQEIPSNDPKEMTEEDVHDMLEIVLVLKFKVEALQVKYLIIDWEIHTEDADDVLWKLQRYMHAPLTWKLYTDCGVHHVSSTRGHHNFMLTEKDYPLSNAVMILMLSGKLQVEEDNEMVRDLVMKIFIEANKPKSISLDTSSK